MASLPVRGMEKEETGCMFTTCDDDNQPTNEVRASARRFVVLPPISPQLPVFLNLYVHSAVNSDPVPMARKPGNRQSELSKTTFRYRAAQLYADLPDNIKNIDDKLSFQKAVKQHY